VRTFIDILLALLALMVQSSFGSRLSIFGLLPDFVLLVVIYVALSKGSVEGVIYGFLTGFVQDVYSPSTLGIGMLSKTVIGFGVGYGRGKIPIESGLVRWIVIFLTALVHDLLYFLFYLRGDLPRMLSWFFRFSIGSAIYTATVGSAIFLIYSYFAGRRSHARSGSQGLR